MWRSTLAIAFSLVSTKVGLADTWTDSFSGPKLDTSWWSVLSNPPSSTVEVKSGELELTLAAGYPEKANAITKFLVEGDFDVQVDFHLAQWPSHSHRVGIGVGGPGGVAVERMHDFGPGDLYLVHLFNGLHSIPTADSMGSLRFVRTGSTYSGYFLGSSGWTLIGVGPGPQGAVPLSLQVWNAPWSANPPPATIQYDNFSVTADSMVPITDIAFVDQFVTGFTAVPTCPGQATDLKVPCAESENGLWHKLSWHWGTASEPPNIFLEPYNIGVTGGLVVLATCPGPPLEGAQLETNEEYGFGRYRVRMRTSDTSHEPADTGVVNGFFVYREGHGEIDIEIRSKNQTASTGKIEFAVHDFATGSVKTKMHDVTFSPYSDFHVYGFDWYSDRVEFFVDPTPLNPIPTQVISTADGIAIPELPGTLILNSWTGNGFSGLPPSTSTGMVIDWVSYYNPGALLSKYGTGCAGTGGFAPELNVSGLPSPGSTIALGITGTLPNTGGFLAIGSSMDELLLGPSCLLHVSVPFLLAALPTTNAGGESSLSVGIPVSVAPGTTGTLQGLMIDAGSSTGLSTTNGVIVTIH